MSRGPGNVRRVPLAIFADNPKPLSRTISPSACTACGRTALATCG